MKKILAVLAAVMLLVSVVSAAHAGYSDYYTAKKAAVAAEQAGELATAVDMYLKAANEASVLAAQDNMKLPWKLYAEWQVNNAAYVYVKHFKTVTNWESDMEALKAIENGPERLKALSVLYDKARPYLGELEAAKQILKSSQITKAEVIAKAKSNLEFCEWVLKNVGVK
jgi:uncharacterized protein YxeA